MLRTLWVIALLNNKFSDFSKWNSGIIIFALALVVYTYLFVLLTKKFIFSYGLKTYSPLKAEIKSKLLGDL